MRIAIIADIHGNPLALDAVLADIRRRGGIEGYWLLGDYCAIGFDPAGVLERLAELPNALLVRGNADRYIITGERPGPTLEQVLQDPRQARVLAEVAGSFAWTQGFCEARGWTPCWAFPHDDGSACKCRACD